MDIRHSIVILMDHTTQRYDIWPCKVIIPVSVTLVSDTIVSVVSRVDSTMLVSDILLEEASLLDPTILL